MLRTRLIFGPVMLLTLFLLFYVDERFAIAPGEAGPWWRRPGFALLFAGLAVCPVACWELKQILRALGIMASRGMLVVAAVVGMAIPWVIPDSVSALTAVSIVSTAAAFVLVASLVRHSRTRTTKGVTAASGASLFAFVYFGLMFGFVLALRREHPAWVVLAVLVITKSCDIGAYFTGTLIGRHKLILWLSPGKTWEGLVGGVLTASVLGTVAVWWLQVSGVDASLKGMALWQGAFMGALFAITGQTGDLVASLLKRDAGIKDSSSVVPGFGGVLDVIDSILPAAPVAYWLLHRAA